MKQRMEQISKGRPSLALRKRVDTLLVQKEAQSEIGKIDRKNRVMRKSICLLKKKLVEKAVSMNQCPLLSVRNLANLKTKVPISMQMKKKQPERLKRKERQKFRSASASSFFDNNAQAVGEGWLITPSYRYCQSCSSTGEILRLGSRI